jgi:hypothetical protein
MVMIFAVAAAFRAVNPAVSEDIPRPDSTDQPQEQTEAARPVAREEAA